MTRLFLLTIPFMAVGCESIEALSQWWGSPDPTLGGTPGEALGEGISGVVVNPANPLAWLKIVGVVVAAIGVGIGAKKLASKKAEPK